MAVPIVVRWHLWDKGGPGPSPQVCQSPPALATPYQPPKALPSFFTAQFLPLGASFWNSSDCSHRCHCGQQGQVRCWPEGCLVGQRCVPAHPFQRCQAPRGPSCRLGPQGHLQTLTGGQLRLQPCRFVLALLPGDVRVEVELGGKTPEPAILVRLLVSGQDLVVKSDSPAGHVLVSVTRVQARG